ncbi:hypothetical protein DFP73DRAFT_553396 [Morchella snyderi]|nr:hypothetical protein DFP73DRAFT_553396 [Morchella snyderi]
MPPDQTQTHPLATTPGSRMSHRRRVARSGPSAATAPTAKPQRATRQQQQQQNASESESQEYPDSDGSSGSDEFRGCSFTEDDEDDDDGSTHAADATDDDADPASPATAPAQSPTRPATIKGLKPGDVRTKLVTPHGHKPKPRDGPLSAIRPKRTTVATDKGPRKRLLYRQGEGALLDVYNTQKGTELLLPRAAFARLVKEISDGAAAAPLNWTKDGVEALQQYTESFLTTHLSSMCFLLCVRAWVTGVLLINGLCLWFQWGRMWLAMLGGRHSGLATWIC